MKKIIATALIAANLIAFVVSLATASYSLIQAQVVSVHESVTKNSQPYVRIIINERRTLNGIEYTAPVPAIAFGHLVPKAKTMKPGTTLKAIVTKSTLNGKTSYVINAILE